MSKEFQVCIVGQNMSTNIRDTVSLSAVEDIAVSAGGSLDTKGYKVAFAVNTSSAFAGSATDKTALTYSTDELIGYMQSLSNINVIIRSDSSKANKVQIAFGNGNAESKALANFLNGKLNNFSCKEGSFSSDGIENLSISGLNKNVIMVVVNVGNIRHVIENKEESDSSEPFTDTVSGLVSSAVLEYLESAGIKPENSLGGTTDDPSYTHAQESVEAVDYDIETPNRPSVQASISAAAEANLMNVYDKQITLTCDYLVYFDDVLMNDFVLSYSCNLGVDIGIGRASVSVIYAPSFNKIAIDGANIDGIDNGTQVRIFMRNVFAETYNMCFEGIIKQKVLTRDAHGFTLSFVALDYMYWMNKIIAPISIPLNEAISPGERLKWKAQSVDPEITANVEITQAGSLKGKTLVQYFDVLKTKSFKNSKIYSEPNSVANWDDTISRVEIMGDINEQLVRDEVIDFVVNSNAVFADTVYVSLSNTTQSLMMEMYQDRDGIVRIKPPFWNEPVLKNHVIDPMMILSAQESTDWNKYYTRIIVTGGVEEWMDSGTTAEKVDLITPVGVYLGSLTDKSSAKWADYTSEGDMPSSYGDTYGDSSDIVSTAKKYLGTPYVWGGTDAVEDGGLDCSGFVYNVLRDAGHTASRTTAQGYRSYGTSVNKSDMQSGDLVFFGRSSEASHIGIYIGNGQMIHSSGNSSNTKSNPGKGVSYADVNYRSDFIEARRL